MLLNLALMCTITTACSVRRYFTKTTIFPLLPAVAHGRLLINATPIKHWLPLKGASFVPLS
ncbi:MAG: hypothetical protein GWP45_02105 [Proteobacteria bacterium]|nr:hypothetical protein [Pseudomonadota bacterium]